MGSGAGRERPAEKMQAAGSKARSARDRGPKSISHEHTYNQDTANVEQLEATLMRLSEMVGRRLREAAACTPEPCNSNCVTKTSPPSPARTRSPHPRNWTTKFSSRSIGLFHTNWRKGAEVRLLGVQASSFGQDSADNSICWKITAVKDGSRRLSAADRLRDKFGESSITLATGMKGGFRERTHENPASECPEKDRRKIE